MNEQEVLAYVKRQRAVHKAFEGMLKGARQNASFDLRLELTTLGQVISGTKISPPTLVLIERWLTTNGEAWKKE